jgi:hypothetical protein
MSLVVLILKNFWSKKACPVMDGRVLPEGRAGLRQRVS